jgi:hypothetical protein
MAAPSGRATLRSDLSRSQSPAACRPQRVPLRELSRVDSRAQSPESTDDETEDVPLAPPTISKGLPCGSTAKRSRDRRPPLPVFEPVRMISVGQSSVERTPAASITKGYEYERGRLLVTLAPEELRSIPPTTSTEMEITAFVRLPERSTRSILRPLIM